MDADAVRVRLFKEGVLIAIKANFVERIIFVTLKDEIRLVGDALDLAV